MRAREFWRSGRARVFGNIQKIDFATKRKLFSVAQTVEPMKQSEWVTTPKKMYRLAVFRQVAFGLYPNRPQKRATRQDVYARHLVEFAHVCQDQKRDSPTRVSHFVLNRSRIVKDGNRSEGAQWLQRYPQTLATHLRSY
jgi:hypothetical protein